MVGPHDSQAWRVLQTAAAQPQIDAALRDLYARLDTAVAARGPTCWQSGKCCRFDSYGHRLYVTALEIAWFLHQPESAPNAPPSASLALPQLRAGALPDACRYQVDGLCSTHAIRPLGCRIFFCQAGTQAWQQDLYETFLDELRSLHDRHALPYRYLEWRAGLIEAEAELGNAPSSI